MTERISLSQYKRLTSQMSVSSSGRVVPVSTVPRTIRVTVDTPKKATKPNKYGAKKTEVDGITFDSKLEARRYMQLMDMLRHGLIRGLLRQVRYSLDVNGKKIGTYIADFVYTDVAAGVEIIEDAKGVLTPLYRRSKKHFEAQYGMKITEITK